MQLKFDNIKPIVLAGAAIVGGANFLYTDMNQYSQIDTIAENRNTSSYLDLLDENNYSHIFINTLFKDLLRKWKEDTVYSSSAREIIENQNFQHIVSLGEPIVPLIISEIKERPSTLVWALNIIFKTKISEKPNTTIKDACKLWVKTLDKE